jgi:DNA-binding CsgD family transcriptional regulator/tetratricopeptide (TPR) repeat protein
MTMGRVRARITGVTVVRSGVLVGRQPQLEVLRMARDRANAGIPTVIVVEGEAGIGKTRLIREMASETAELDPEAVIATGHGVHLSVGAIPYGVVASLLQDLALEVGEDTVASLLGPRASALAPLVVGLPGSSPPDGVPLDRLALFGAVQRLLGLLSHDRLVCLFVEDVHWADAASLDLLVFLARAARPGRLLIVATARPVAPTEDLTAEGLAELTDAAGPMLRLGPLDAAEVALQVHAALGETALPPTALADIQRLSDGVPLYVEELLAVSARGSDASAAAPQVPTKLAVRLTGRLDVLGPLAVQVVQAASVEERPFDAADLAIVTGVPDPDVEEALRDAMDAGVLDQTGPRRYRFHHALLREAVSADLPSTTRAAWHRGWAEVLGTGRDSLETLTAIADHHYHGGDVEAALEATVRAALAAWSSGAYRETASQLVRALDLWPMVADAETVAGVPRDRLVVTLATAYSGIRDVASARQLVDAEERTNSTPSLTERSWYLLWRWGLEPPTVDALDDAPEVSQLVAEPPSWMLLDVLEMCLMFTAGAHADPRPFLDLYDSTASALHVDHAAGLSLLRRAEAAYFSRDYDAMLAAATRALEEGLLPPSDRWWGVNWRHIGLWTFGRFHELVREGTNELDQMGSPEVDQTSWRTKCHHVSLAMLMLGDHDRCEALLSSLDQVDTPNVKAPQWATRAIVAAVSGRFDAATAFLDTAEGWLPPLEDDDSRHFRGGRAAVRAGRAWLAVESGHPADAYPQLEPVLVREALGRDSPFEWGHVYIAAAGLGAGSERHARVVREAAHKITMPGPLGEAALGEIDAHLDRAAGTDSPEQWRETAERWRDLFVPLYEARARLREAECLLDRSDLADRHEQARTALQRALDNAIATGAAPLAGRVQDFARRARIPLAGAASVRSSSDGAGAPHHLTERETDVLRELVAGSTNEQIGAALYMSPKTASVHVSHIIAKLGATNRTEVASIAHRLGLLDEAHD